MYSVKNNFWLIISVHLQPDRFLCLPPSALLCYPQVCKYFLDAIENNKYGWFWVCPGGGDNCMYRHALPPGFVLKKDKKKEEKEEEISLEELIENEVSTYGGIQGLFGNLQVTDLRNKQLQSNIWGKQGAGKRWECTFTLVSCTSIRKCMYMCQCVKKTGNER